MIELFTPEYKDDIILENESYLTQLEVKLDDRIFSDIQEATKWLNKYSDVWNNYKKLTHIQSDKFISYVGHILNKHITDQSLREHSYIRFDHLLKKRQNERQIFESIEPEIQF